MKALGYARVSLEDENIENQILAIEDFCKQNNLDLIKVFTDEAISRDVKPFDRPGLKKLIEASKLLDVKNIVVHDLTRFGGLFEAIELYRWFLEHGYTVYFVKHPELNTNPESPLGQAMKKALLALLGILSELERAMIRERTRQGLERARRQGKRLGRPPYPFPAEEVKKLLKQGYSIAETHRILTLQRKICVKKNGSWDCMKYETFRRKVKQLLTG